jgi:hypothetical protein
MLPAYPFPEMPRCITYTTSKHRQLSINDIEESQKAAVQLAFRRCGWPWILGARSGWLQSFPHSKVQPVLDLCRNAVAGLDLFLVQPHAHAVPLQAHGQFTCYRLVLRTVTQENVKWEFLRHRVILWLRRRLTRNWYPMQMRFTREPFQKNGNPKGKGREPTLAHNQNRLCGNYLRNVSRLTSSKSSSKMTIIALCWNYYWGDGLLLFKPSTSASRILINHEEHCETSLLSV